MVTEDKKQRRNYFAHLIMKYIYKKQFGDNLQKQVLQATIHLLKIICALTRLSMTSVVLFFHKKKLLYISRWNQAHNKLFRKIERNQIERYRRQKELQQ